MSFFRSVGARLSLALALVVVVALGVVYLIVVPRLQRDLTNEKLEQLSSSGRVFWTEFPTEALGLQLFEEVDAYIDNASAATGARVVLFRPLSSEAVMPIADSAGTTQGLNDDQIALRVTSLGAPASGIVERDHKRFAEVAFPVPGSLIEVPVLLFSAPLDDTLASVELIKKRLLLAAAIALLLSVLLGYGASSVFAARLRRLERAADRIAQGKLDEPVIDDGSDEVGQLARAFERMRQRLAQLEHARREFIANASHELRTPIFSLGGFLELLDDEDLDDETRREFVATMQEQVERLTKLAADVLDLSRLDAGRLRVELEPVSLERVADALADEFAALALTWEHEVTVDARPAPLALADEARVLQIGRVLVENALKHTPPGTPIVIRVGGRGERAVFAVEDAGGGIALEHAPQVFDRFYRVEGTHASGSGLGLAIARELAEAMNGTLELESRPGRTVFTLRLPVAAAVQELEPAQPAVS
jgi:two-component system, OmpR family, sensor kinase